MRQHWFLIEGQLPARHPCLRATAVFPSIEDTRERRLPLPVSLAGRLVEVVCMPTPDFRIEVVDETGVPVAGNIRVRRIGALGAYFRMLRRVVAAWFWMDTRLLRRMGLGWVSVVRNLPLAYRHVGSLRYHFHEPDYHEWFTRYWTLQGRKLRRLRRFMAQSGAAALPVRIVIDARAASSPDDIDRSLQSVKRQLGRRPAVTVLESGQDWCGDEPDHGLVLWLGAGTVLEPWALAWFLKAFLSAPDSQLLYSDHDELSAEGTLRNPHFKPDWSPDLQLCSHYVGDVVAVRAAALQSVLARLDHVPDAYELAAELALGGGAVHHIPAVLWHQQGESFAPTPERLARILQRHHIDATVTRDTRHHVRIQYAPPSTPPLVSIIVPTRDMLHMLKPCVESVLTKTRWPRLEILIVDNQSTCPETLAYLQQVQTDTRVRVLRYDRPFNFAAINNFAVAQARGELVCLLNNDTEVINPDWLEEMVTRLLQPGVGVVGARLYFSDGRVQHAGDVLGPGGCAHHLFGILEADDPGYLNRAVLPQDLSAVTAACLLTSRTLYQRLGGLDADHLPVAFNDVDYCLRVREAGLRVVYTPYAELYHHESVSRGRDDSDEKRARSERELAYMYRRWPDVIRRDPFYNPNLNYARPDCTLGKVPRIDWPW